MASNSKIAPIKVVLVGEIQTGKTNLITKIVSDSFKDQYESTFVPNDTTKYYEKDNKSFIINFWDTAGQEKFRTLTKLFYKNAQVVVFVYSIIDRKSFEGIKKYWINEIKENLGDKIGKVIDFIYLILL
jgi:small GTP-binding protein